MDKAIAKKRFETREEAIAFGQSLDRPFLWGQDTDTKLWRIFPLPEGTKITLEPIVEKVAEVIPIRNGVKNDPNTTH